MTAPRRQRRSFLRILTCLLASSTATVVAEDAWENSKAYANGDFGRYPIQEYKSGDWIAPRPNLVRQDSRCSPDFYTFLSPRGYHGGARHAQATILDQRGNLVWTSGWGDHQIYNFQQQMYKGNPVLTFWAGNDAVGGHGAGKYYMLNQNYELIKEFEGANGIEGDLHEFKITKDNTVLITAYAVKDVDLSPLGKEVDGRMWECYFQEIDLETGKAIFQWAASDHVNLTDSLFNVPDNEPWDFYHINSIDKDGDGNYVVSSRFYHAIHKVEKETGRLLWTLGGKSNDFKDLSNGKATDFKYQHHVNWHNDDRELTMFDNSALFSDQSNPRGLRVQVDQKAMTVKLLTEYRNPQVIPASSQGSMQEIENGNVIMGYGYTGAWAEFTYDGEFICDTHISPQINFGSGDVQSYRVMKFHWQGFPNTRPAIKVDKDDLGMWRVWTAWNGATEVAQWELEMADTNANEMNWESVETKAKYAFEDSFYLRDGLKRFVRVKALDAEGRVLGVTEAAAAGMAMVTYEVPEEPALSSHTAPPLHGIHIQGSASGDSFLWFCIALAAAGGYAAGVCVPRIKAGLKMGRRMSGITKYTHLGSEESGIMAQRHTA